MQRLDQIRLEITHKSGFKEMLGHEDLIRWINSSLIDPTLPDLGHAVDAGQEHHKDGGTNGLDHDWPTTTLDAIQAHYHQLPQWGLEQQHQYQCHFRQYHREQQLLHCFSLFFSFFFGFGGVVGFYCCCCCQDFWVYGRKEQ